MWLSLQSSEVHFEAGKSLESISRAEEASLKFRPKDRPKDRVDIIYNPSIVFGCHSTTKAAKATWT